MTDRVDIEWLTDDEAAAWEDFVLGATHLISRLDAEVSAAARLSHLDYGILAMLSGAPDGRVRMSALATAFGVDPSVITYRVRRMGERGLVERARCPEDRRGVHAVITEVGRTVLAELAPTHVGTVRREFIDLLTARELAVIGEVFAKIRAHQQRVEF